MSPLVRRTITEELEHLYSKQSMVHTMYVHPRAKQPGDVVVPVGEIDDATLRDLAVTAPKEYAAAAKTRGLEPELDDDFDDEAEGEPEIEFTDEQEMFLALGDDEAVAQVNATEDPELLASFLDAEQKSVEPRRAVVKAILAKAEG